MSLAHPLLAIEAADEPDVYVIRVEGELDRAGTPELESVLANAELSRADRNRARPRWTEFHRRGRPPNAGRRRAQLGGQWQAFDLTRGTGEVARMFRLTMLDLTLPFTDPVETQASSVTPERVGS